MGSAIDARLGVGAEAAQFSRVLLEEIVVGAAGLASIDFQNIPQTCEHLEIRLLARSEAAASTDARIRFNNDSGANYWSEEISGTGTTAAATGQDSQTSGRIARVPTSAGSQRSISIIEIPFYRQTGANDRKFAMARTAMHDGTIRDLRERWVLWTSSNAIDRVALFLESGADFDSGSKAQLYGLRTVEGVGGGGDGIGGKLALWTLCR